MEHFRSNSLNYATLSSMGPIKNNLSFRVGESMDREREPELREPWLISFTCRRESMSHRLPFISIFYIGHMALFIKL